MSFDANCLGGNRGLVVRFVNTEVWGVLGRVKVMCGCDVDFEVLEEED